MSPCMKDSKRSLVWFVVFHPAFYQNKTKVVFAKKKIDMLHKDAKCRKADDDFCLTLHVASGAQKEADDKGILSIELCPSTGDREPERSASTFLQDESMQFDSLLARAHLGLAVQSELCRFFRTHGRLTEFAKGDDILNAGSIEASMMMVESGVAEGLVMSNSSNKMVAHRSSTAHAAHHPCGSQISGIDLENGFLV